MRATIVLLALLAWKLTPAHGQLGTTNLRKIGVVPGRTYTYSIASTSHSKTIAIKMIPNVAGMSGCGSDAVKQYTGLVDQILAPVSAYLELFKKSIKVETVNLPTRLFGAIIGTVALGVATSAQITAGIALDNSLKNAEAINSLTDAMLRSNMAIETLTSALGDTVTMINGVQEQVNNEIVPAINSLGCAVATNRLAIALTQYYSVLDTTFGPSLQNPAMAGITIQGLSALLGGNLDRLLTGMGYTLAEVRDLLEQNLITGTVTMVNSAARLLLLEVQFPNLVRIGHTSIQELNTITYQHDGSEWFSTIPSFVTVRGPLINGIRHNDCTIGQSTIICNKDQTYAFEPSLVSCLSGNTASCTRTRIVTSVAPRFLISETRVLANCISTLCTCISSGNPILQSKDDTLMDISFESCGIIAVDGVMIKPGTQMGNVSFNSSGIDFGPVVSVDPLDQSALLGQIYDKLNSTLDSLAASNAILNSIDTSIVNSTTVGIIMAVMILLIIMVVGVIITICIMRSNGKKRDKYAASMYQDAREFSWRNKAMDPQM